MKISRCLYLLLLAFLAFRPEMQAQDFITLEGKILAADSKEPVPFASIGIPEKGIGNICNEAGNFESKIPADNKNAKVCITALGFKELCLPVSSFQAKNHTVLLEPANLQLATVEIKAISGESLVREAIRRIPENYAAQPVRYTFYQQEQTNINKQPAFIIESVSEAYFNYPKKDYQFMIHKSRGMIINKDKEDKMERSYISFYDIINNSIPGKNKNNDFLHPSKFRNYNFTILKEEVLGNDTVYVISFSPKPKRNGEENAGYLGKLFLQKKYLAIARMESEPNDAFLQHINNSFLLTTVEKFAKTDFTFKSKLTQVNYKRIGSRWYLHDVLTKASIQKVYRDNPIPEQNNNFRQLVVSNFQTSNPQQIPKNQQIESNLQPFNNAPKDMNEAYWQEYNVLPLPEGFEKVTTQ